MGVRGTGGISRWRNRRRVVLLVFSVVYALLGYSFAYQSPQGATGAVQVAAELVPLAVWGWVWVSCGAVMAWSAIKHWDEQGGGDLGFAVAVGMPVLWGALSGVSWLVADAPRGWVTALVYWALALAIYSIAGMVDPRFGGRP
jgi:hypothetical protein